MSRMLTVAIDAMSGDGGTSVIIDAVRAVLKERDDAHLTLVGDPDHINKAI
ncbi:MAG: fatty acid/phospholipid biosynthesis enzyme, partial [Porticoccaceae bacterium]